MEKKAKTDQALARSRSGTAVVDCLVQISAPDRKAGRAHAPRAGCSWLP